MASLAQIQDWWEENVVPTIAQRMATFESFRHVDEGVPLADVTGLVAALNDKASKAVVDSLTDKFYNLSTAAFMGYALTSTNPGTPTSQKWYFAKQGTYTNFLNSSAAAIVVPAKSGSLDVLVAILHWTGTAWDSILLTVDLTEITDQLDALDAAKVNKADLPTFSKISEGAYVNGKEVIKVETDSNGDVLHVIYKDGTSNYIDMAVLNAAIATEAAARAAADATLQTNIDLKANIADMPAAATIVDVAYVNGKEVIKVETDSNGDVLHVIYKDGTSNYIDMAVLNAAIATEAAARAAADATLQTNIDLKANIADMPAAATIVDVAYVNGKEVIKVETDSNGDVVSVIFKDGTTFFGDVPGLFTEVSVARGANANLNDRFKNVIKSYAIPTTPIWGGERLRRWIEWNRTRDYRYDWLLLGDSYTAGFYSEYLRKFLVSDGYPDGGAGWCSFSRFGTTIGTANGSINFEDLSFNYTPSQWDFVNTNTLGLNGHVVANAANAVITITATQLVSSITLVYEKHSGAGSFRYRVNTGSWTTVSTANATQTIGSTVIDTSSLTASFTVELEALDTGIIFMGCIGRKSGNVLCLHKAGISGGNAGMMAQNQVWSDNAALTTPKGVAIMFGTNEMSGGTLPSVFRTNLENIITKIRAIEPYCDILIMSPTYTKYETENPTAFSLDAYAQVAFEVAIKYEAAFIDFAQGFGAFSQAAIDAGFMNTDRLHPGKPRGAKYMAELILKLLK
jgi:flagellar hook assembly protein FlgD